MTDRATEFLDHWESEHVEPVAGSERITEAKRLASLCRDDAIRAGIAEKDLDGVVNGDLVGNMLHALDAASLRESDK